MEPIETIEYRGCTISIYRDEDPDSPRTWMDDLGTIATWHRRYKLGDIQPKETPQEFVAALPEGTIILPVYMFDHSGLTISTSDATFRASDSHGWDWGQLGVIYCTPDRIRKEYDCQDITPEIEAKVRGVLEAEIATYDQYLTGDIYGFKIEGVDDEIDSVWGFYGTEAAITDAKEIIDGYVVREEGKRWSKIGKAPEEG